MARIFLFPPIGGYFFPYNGELGQKGRFSLYNCQIPGILLSGRQESGSVLEICSGEILVNPVKSFREERNCAILFCFEF